MEYRLNVIISLSASPRQVRVKRDEGAHNVHVKPCTPETRTRWTLSHMPRDPTRSPPFTGGDPTPRGTKGWYAGGRILEPENPNHQLGPNHHMLHQGKRGTPESDCISPLEVQSRLIVI
jgi:hypothetical protein